MYTRDRRPRRVRDVAAAASTRLSAGAFGLWSTASATASSAEPAARGAPRAAAAVARAARDDARESPVLATWSVRSP